VSTESNGDERPLLVCKSFATCESPKVFRGTGRLEVTPTKIVWTRDLLALPWWRSRTIEIARVGLSAKEEYQLGGLYGRVMVTNADITVTFVPYRWWSPAAYFVSGRLARKLSQILTTD